MGNAAAKQVESTTLVTQGSINVSSTIAPSLLTSESIIAKNKGSKWIQKDTTTTLFTMKKQGMIHSHSLIYVGDMESDDDDVSAYVITVKKGMTSETCYICKTSPSFDTQQPLDEKQLKKAGVKDSEVQLYPFSMLMTERTMTTGTCTYSKIVGTNEDGKDDDDDDDKTSFQTEVVYTGEKLSAMGFQALFKEGDNVVAKASTKGMSMTPSVEFAQGVDVIAVILMGYSLAGDANAAGALAGAGAV